MSGTYSPCLLITTYYCLSCSVLVSYCIRVWHSNPRPGNCLLGGERFTTAPYSWSVLVSHRNRMWNSNPRPCNRLLEGGELFTTAHCSWSFLVSHLNRMWDLNPRPCTSMIWGERFTTAPCSLFTFSLYFFRFYFSHVSCSRPARWSTWTSCRSSLSKFQKLYWIIFLKTS